MLKVGINFKKSFFVGILIISIIIATCSCDDVPTVKTSISKMGETQKNNKSLLVKKSFTYESNPVIVLKKEKPNPAWTHTKDFTLNNIGGFNKIKVAVYTDNGVSKDFGVSGIMYAYLDDGVSEYSISSLSNFGIEYVNIIPKDVNDDGLNEFVIELKFSHGGNTIVGYNKEKHKWEILLQTGGIEFVDFEGTGKQTLVTAGKGSIAPLVDIHYWKKDHFETLNCQKELGLDRLGIQRKSNEVYLVQGSWSEGEKPRCFQYKDETIFEVPNPF